MKKTTFMRNLDRRTRRIVLASAAGIAAAGILTFVLAFRVTAVEVVGNTRFTEKEIREMALTGPFSWNTLLIERFHNHVETEEALIESIDLERVGNNKIVIRVNEKQLIGYVQYQGKDWYFDVEGTVLESADSADGQAEPVTADTGAAPAEGAEASGETAEEEVLAPQSIEDEDSGQDAEEEKEAGGEPSEQFNPALTDVPLVTGLSFDSVTLGEQLPVKNTKVFNTIHGIARMVDKYDIIPDSVEFDGEEEITLHYGNVRVQLGQDEELEEKLIRVAAILPSIRGLSGVLHMEDFTGSEENIIFEKDLTEEQQQAQDEAARERMEAQEEENGGSDEDGSGADDEEGSGGSRSNAEADDEDEGSKSRGNTDTDGEDGSGGSRGNAAADDEDESRSSADTDGEDGSGGSRSNAAADDEDESRSSADTDDEDGNSGSRSNAEADDEN